MPGTVPTSQILANVTAGATTVSGSVTYTSGAVYIMAFYAHHATVAFTDTTTVSGMSLTWTKLGTVRGGAVPNNEILTVFVGYGAGATGAVTITPSQAPAAGRFTIIEQKEATGSGLVNPFSTHTYTNSGTGTTGTCPYTTLTEVGGKLFSFFGHRIAEVASPDTNWTELSDASTTTAALQVQYANTSDFSPGSTWATSSSWLALACEMKTTSYTGQKNSADTFTVVEARRSGQQFEDDEAVWAYV
jgi:hypothetical protein